MASDGEASSGRHFRHDGPPSPSFALPIEPSEASWVDETTGLPALILRNHFEVYCGYVGVGREHPWHDTSWDSCTLSEPCWGTLCSHSPASVVNVHGGLDYAGVDPAGAPLVVLVADAMVRASVANAGELWWFGFHCGHAFDLTPEHVRTGHSRLGARYRPLDYVREEVRVLAQQLGAVR